jgi:hypothetical protein
VSFFDALPVPEPEPEHVEHRPPPWSGAPDNVLPVGVALNAVLVRTDEVAITITDARAYPTGIAFGVSMVRRVAPRPPGDHPFLIHGPGEGGDARFGVGFSDGRRAVFDQRWADPAGDPPAIRIGSSGGGGGGRRWHVRMWLWPLPPEGPLTFALTWPDQGIGETTVEVDSAPLRQAAARAVELWPDERPLAPRDGGGRWSAYGSG